MSAKAALEKVELTGDLSPGAPEIQRDFFAFDAPATTGEQIVRTGKPGRPEGATNKTTREFIDFFQRTKGDPRLALGTVMASSISELKEALGCTRLEAAEFWKSCTVALLPYIAGKPAVEIAVKSDKTVLNIFAGAPGEALQMPRGGIVEMLEHAAAQARAEGFDGTVIDAEAHESTDPTKSEG